MNGLTLRRASPTDAEAFARMMSEPEVFGGTLQMPYADADYWRTRLSDAAAAGKVDLHLVAQLDGHLVGSAGVHPAGSTPRRRHALGLGITVAKRYALRDGVYVDALAMARLHPNPPQVKSPDDAAGQGSTPGSAAWARGSTA